MAYLRDDDWWDAEGKHQWRHEQELADLAKQEKEEKENVTSKNTLDAPARVTTRRKPK
jgi:hypothetical protein